MNKEKAIELKKSMILLEEKRVELSKRQDKFNEENKTLFEYIHKIRDSIDRCKEVLIENAEVEYAKTGNKKLEFGIGIRVVKKLVYEPKEALKWAKDHSLCLCLDKRAFDSFAKSQEIDFVLKEEKVLVTFPKEIKLGEVK